MAIRRVQVRRVSLALGETSDFETYRINTAESKEPETLDWLDHHVREGDTLFDVGANIGLFALYASLIRPGVTSHGFEPVPPNAASFMRNVVNNHLTQAVTVHSLALDETTGVIRVTLANLEPGGSMHSLAGSDGVEVFGERAIMDVSVVAVALDDFVQATNIKPTLLKIDVDGSERRVLSGARATLNLECLRSVLVEVNWKEGELPSDTLEPLRRAGFVQDRIGPMHRRGYMNWCNYIFVR